MNGGHKLMESINILAFAGARGRALLTLIPYKALL